MKYDVKIDENDYAGDNILHIAVRNQHYLFLRYVLNLKLRYPNIFLNPLHKMLNSKNNHGKLPIDVAKNENIKNLLMNVKILPPRQSRCSMTRKSLVRHSIISKKS